MFDGTPPDDQSALPHEAHAESDKLRYRAIWISDIHLGTIGCQADLLLEFLKYTESKYLYLVGVWVESLSALVETEDGELKIVTWHDLHAARLSASRGTVQADACVNADFIQVSHA